MLYTGKTHTEYIFDPTNYRLMKGSPLFADIILPLPLVRNYTFLVPEELILQAAIGKRAVVQFGEKRLYSGMIERLHHEAPETGVIKPLQTILDDEPVALDSQIGLWKWMADYYMCTMGEVYKAALPSALKLESETEIRLVPGEFDMEMLSDAEKAMISQLGNKDKMSLGEISTSFRSQGNALSVARSLLQKNIVEVSETLVEKPARKKEKILSLLPEFYDAEKYRNLFIQLKKAPEQIRALSAFSRLAGNPENGIPEPVSWDELLAEESVKASALKALVKRNILAESWKTAGLQPTLSPVKETKTLNSSQQLAMQQLKQQMENFDVVLLHGVTSSGKTEIYIRLIAECLERGEQVLYLLPEIALTTQIINRLRAVFGDQTGVYHSRFSGRERLGTWYRMLEKDPSRRLKIILGARSAIFLPFHKLGMVIVDEEHENTYKQFDPAPRYHARDTAIMLAHMHGAKVILGTATPSVESFFNARLQKYGMVYLGERHRQLELPEIRIVDLAHAYKSRQMQGEFSNQLLKEIQRCLETREQVILFQNRRGYSPFVQCHDCGWVPYCRHCDVALTYHKASASLVCHYCGYTRHMPTQCDACQSTDIRTKGFGTEKIQDELRFIFPDAHIARLDLDVARSRKAYENIIGSFEKREIDILIGTQMISKGLDFDHVSLVGILNADNMLNYPDFRAFERSFQLITQVSGRAGRKGKRGLVLVQTFTSKHPVLKDVVNNDFLHMMEVELAERKKYHYPPYVRMIRLSIRHRQQETAEAFASLIASELRTLKQVEVLGPGAPPISRLRNEYIREILVKIPRSESIQAMREAILSIFEKYHEQKTFTSVRLMADVDPQ